MNESKEEKKDFIESPGAYLKQERELRGINLRDVADHMKLSLDCLKNLEADNYKELPAPVFLKGYFKTYAEYLGLDPNEVLLIYEQYKNYIENENQTKDIDNTLEKKKKNLLILFFLFVIAILILILFITRQ